jgi:hypothetical protein
MTHTQVPHQVRPVVDPNGRPSVCIQIGTDWFAFNPSTARDLASGILSAAVQAEEDSIRVKQEPKR